MQRGGRCAIGTADCCEWAIGAAHHGEPLSPASLLLVVTLPVATHAKLRKLQDLLAHRPGDLVPEILDQAPRRGGPKTRPAAVLRRPPARPPIASRQRAIAILRVNVRPGVW